MTEQQPEREWEPGDPLYTPGGYSNYFYNFRDDPIEDEHLHWADAARWPEPLQGRVVPDDPLEPFITQYHAWHARQEQLDRVEQIAESVGLELLPHQRDVLDQALARRQAFGQEPELADWERALLNARVRERAAIDVESRARAFDLGRTNPA